MLMGADDTRMYMIFFRIPFTIYFLAKDKEIGRICLLRKQFNGTSYRWIVV